jgi:hypothetical protein
MGNLWLNKLFELRFQFSDMLFLGVVVFGLLTMQQTTIPVTDALIASRMRLGPGGQTQPRMREGFDHTRDYHTQWSSQIPMVFSDNHPDFSLRGKPKGLEAVLRERGLWPAGG